MAWPGALDAYQVGQSSCRDMKPTDISPGVVGIAGIFDQSHPTAQSCLIEPCLKRHKERGFAKKDRLHPQLKKGSGQKNSARWAICFEGSEILIHRDMKPCQNSNTRFMTVLVRRAKTVSSKGQIPGPFGEGVTLRRHRQTPFTGVDLANRAQIVQTIFN
jgi:hypothetical protein